MTKHLSSEALQQASTPFLDVRWIATMWGYANTVGGMNMPAPPADLPGMPGERRSGKPIPSVAELMKRLHANAAAWEPLLKEMNSVATGIKRYAQASLLTLKGYDKLSNETGSLSAKQKKKLALLQSAVKSLQGTAQKNQAEAVRMLNKVLDYRRDLAEDREVIKDVAFKYQDWMTKQDEDIHIWEDQHGLKKGETAELIKKLREDVEAFNKKYQGLAGGAGAATAGMVVLPPFGTIAALIAITALAAEAEKARRQMEEFRGRLDRVQKFNEVKLFFEIAEEKFSSMDAELGKAHDILAGIAGHWALIAEDLATLSGDDMVGTGGLGDGDEPPDFLKMLGVAESFETLMKHAEVFVSASFFDKAIQVIDARKAK